MDEFLVEDRNGVRRVRLGKQMTIGRSWNNDLVLYSPIASRYHAWVWRQGEATLIEDRGSTHGTVVNGQRLTGPRFLNHNDAIIMGDARLTFVSGRYREAEPSPVSPPASQYNPDRTPLEGIPWLMASQLFCAQCGAPNPPQARFCESCGHALSLAVELEKSWQREQPGPRYSLTPPGPIQARPFPVPSAQARPGMDRGTWVLIVLLAILAVILLTMVGILIALTLG